MAAEFCYDKTPIVVNDLGNAVHMNKHYPNLRVPNHYMIREIKPGDSVELTHQGDRFWVKVDTVNEIGDHFEYIGIITDGLVYNHPFTTGDCIIFEGINVLNIFSREWKNTLRISPNE